MNAPSFRWKYVALPSGLLVASALLTAIFYSRLPVRLAIHFSLAGEPAGWFNREATVALFLGLQLVMAFAALLLTWGMTRLAVSFKQTGKDWAENENLVFLMGNLTALPQFIVLFAMAHIFIYNLYGIHIVPVVAMLAIIVLLAAITLVVLFVMAFSRIKRRQFSGLKKED